MHTASPDDRLTAALAGEAPAAAALHLARRLRNEGMARADLLALYDRFRERHAADADETRSDAVLDATAHLAGWSAPARGVRTPRPGY